MELRIHEPAFGATCGVSPSQRWLAQSEVNNQLFRMNVPTKSKAQSIRLLHLRGRRIEVLASRPADQLEGGLRHGIIRLKCPRRLQFLLAIIEIT